MEWNEMEWNWMKWNGMEWVCVKGRSLLINWSARMNREGWDGQCFAFRGNSFFAFHAIWEKSRGRFLAASCLSTNWENVNFVRTSVTQYAEKREGKKNAEDEKDERRIEPECWRRKKRSCPWENFKKDARLTKLNGESHIGGARKNHYSFQDDGSNKHK